MSLTDLLTRLEGGERWDGDNAEVLRALGWTEERHLWVRPDGCLVGKDDGKYCAPLDSVDDALGLVPSPWFSFTAFNAPDGMWSWSLYLDDGAPPTTIDGHGATPAVALTCAILRAKEAEHG